MDRDENSVEKIVRCGKSFGMKMHEFIFLISRDQRLKNFRESYIYL